jgi:hypothetical protein
MGPLKKQFTCQQQAEGRSKAAEIEKARERAETEKYCQQRDKTRRRKKPLNTPADAMRPPAPLSVSDGPSEGEKQDSDDEEEEEEPKVTKAQLAAALAYLAAKQKGKQRAVSPEDLKDPAYDGVEDEEEDEDEVPVSQPRKRGRGWTGKKSAGGSPARGSAAGGSAAVGAAAGGSGHNTTKYVSRKKKTARATEASISKYVWRTHDTFKEQGKYGVADGEHGTSFTSMDPDMKKFVASTCEDLGIKVDYFSYRISQYMNSK